MIDTHTIDWLTLKRKWISIAQGDAWTSQYGIGKKLVASYRDSFVGASAAQTTDWVKNGYDIPGFTGGQVNLAPSRRKRPVWSEDEGQIDRTRLLCGDERYRLTREPRDKPRAAKIEIGYGFRAGVDPKVIGQYGKWCAGLIRKLEAEGLDVQVDIVSRSVSYIIGSSQSCELHIRVQRMNERADFRSWSAIFAPSGHRHLVFLGRAIHADETNRKVNDGFGGSLHRAWSVRTDNEIISIDCCSTSNQDPTNILNEQARACGLID